MNRQSKILYPTKIFFQNEGESKPFQAKQKAESVLYHQPCPEERLKGVLQPEMKGHQTVIQINKKKLRISVKETAYVNIKSVFIYF